MRDRIYAGSTVYLANEIQLLRATPDDILWVGVFHTLDPDVEPTPAQFTEVDLIVPPDPLADGRKIDILSKIGPGLATVVPPIPAGHVTLTGSGDPDNPTRWHRWVAWRTADEFSMTRVDVVEVV